MTIDLSASPIAAAVAKSTVFASTRSFIVGLGGALAGITAILYACGFLVSRAHLSLLGLYGLIDITNDYILQEGAKFFLVTAYTVGRDMVLPALGIVTPLVIAGLLLALRLRPRAERKWNELRSRHLHVDALPLARALAFAALFYSFLWHSGQYLDQFEQPLCIANLLYVDGGTAQCGTARAQSANRIRDALFNADKLLLIDEFEELILGLAIALLIAWLTWLVTLPWRWHALCVAPSFFATALYLLLLPMDYGVLLRAINYPRIALTFTDTAAAGFTGPTFLLKKTPADFVVWVAYKRKVFWVPAASVKRADVDGAYDLLDARWRPPPTKERNNETHRAGFVFISARPWRMRRGRPAGGGKL